MAMTKIKTAAASATILLAVALQWWTQGELKQARGESEALRAEVQRVVASQSEQPAASRQDAADLERLRREAAEVHKLRAEVALLRQRTSGSARPGVGSSQASATENEDDPQTSPMNRMNVARELKAKGKYAEALEHYLWCYDEGLKYSPSFVGVRSSFLLSEISDLAKQFPAAREALETRREASETKVMTGKSDTMNVMELIRLNEQLLEPEKNIALFDQLAPDHPGRATLVDLALEQFVTARRYQDIVNLGNPEALFDRAQESLPKASGDPARDKMVQATMQRLAIKNGGLAIEALAGAGQIDRSAAMVDKVLQFDSSPETRGQLLKHATRAGNEQIITYLNSK